MNETEVAVLAKLAGLDIDPAHLPGVIRNLVILQGQAGVLAEAFVDQLVEPAPVYRP